MPIPLDVSFERTFSGTPKRIYQLLTEMGTSADAIWPFASQPFMRSAGPLVPGQTEEWHLGLHAVLEIGGAREEHRLADRQRRASTERTASRSCKTARRPTVTHRVQARALRSSTGGCLWKRVEDGHQRAIEGLFDKLGRVLKR